MTLFNEPGTAAAIKRVAPGDPLAFPATMFNALADIVDPPGLRMRLDFEYGAVVNPFVQIRNDSGADRDRFDALGVDLATVFDPGGAPSDDDRWSYRVSNSHVGQAVAPAYVGRFVICLEPITAGEFGRALAFGKIAIPVDVGHDHHRFVDIDPTFATHKLKTGNHGAGVILSRDQAAGEAVISLGAWQSPTIRGVVTGSPIVSGGTGTVTVWDNAATGETITAAWRWLEGSTGDEIAVDRQVGCNFDRDAGEWIIYHAQCEPGGAPPLTVSPPI